MGLVLGLASDAVIELNLRIRNSALTEFHFTPKRHVLVSFNSIAHLESPAHAELGHVRLSVTVTETSMPT